MKNNDFDFIKNKFNDAVPTVPDGLSEEAIERKICMGSEHKMIKFRQKRRINIKAVTAAVACFALVLGVVFASYPKFADKDRISAFDSYEDLNSVVSGLEKSESFGGGHGGGPEKSVLVRNETGVEKPASVKTDGEYIYYAYYDSNNIENRNKVYIFKINGESTEFVSIIDELAPVASDLDDDMYEIHDLFVYKNRLVVIMRKNNYALAEKNKRDYSASIVQIYDISDKTAPKLVSEFEQSGVYAVSYMAENILYVSSYYSVSENADENSIPTIKENGEECSVNAKDIVQFENAKKAVYAVISTIDVETGSQKESLKAILGGSAKINCTKENIFISEYSEGEEYTVSFPPRDSVKAIRLDRDNQFRTASPDEISEHINNKVDDGKGESCSSRFYMLDANILSIGSDVNTGDNWITLYDKNMKTLDSVTWNNQNTAVSNDLVIDEERGICAVSAYFADDEKRCFGVITLKIENNHIEVTNEFKNHDENAMYQGKCVLAGDYVYSMNINDDLPDIEKITVYSYKY